MKILLVLLSIFGICVAALLLFLLFVWICGLFVDKTKFYDDFSPFYVFIKNVLLDLILLFSRVKVALKGAEKLPKDSLYLLVSNHRSLYDPLAVMKAMRGTELIFVSKPENFDIPLGGPIARRCCFRTIDRENPRNAIVTIQDCTRLLDEKVAPVVIYPEGTRSKTGELLPFHDGVFKIAQHAKVPIVVMTVRNSDAVQKNAPWRSTLITLTIEDVLPAEEITGVRTAAVGQKVRETMTKSLNQ